MHNVGVEEMGPGDESLRQRYPRLFNWVTRFRQQHISVDRIVRAATRYYGRSVGRQATVVTYAAYFLAFPLLVIYLLLLEWLFSVSPRASDFVIRLLHLPEDTDLTLITASTYDSSLDAFIGLIGIIGVVLAAAATAAGLRSGTQMIFGLTSPRRSLLRAPALDFAAGLKLAVLILASWILVLGSIARPGVFRDVVGTAIPFPLVMAIKFGSLFISLTLMALLMDRSISHLHTKLPGGTRVLGAVSSGVFLTACNYGLLAFLVWILTDPNGGGGFALAIVLLLWVSIVVRGVMFILCWMAADIPEPAVAAQAN